MEAIDSAFLYLYLEKIHALYCVRIMDCKVIHVHISGAMFFFFQNESRICTRDYVLPFLTKLFVPNTQNSTYADTSGLLLTIVVFQE